ncbi:hypothetical protein F5Y04DRAFT_286298 [Hypomontagnella monticulosa]|nr:hypothetical protein F5Y04DRAFT_286298 [Hypomontagnella monticulosa]
MDPSAPKRRKTSPTTSVPVGGSTPSSDGLIRRSTRRQMPSFASPTRASLARSNPDILERRNASRTRLSGDVPAASEADSLLGDKSDAFPKQNPDIEPIRSDTETVTHEAQQGQPNSAYPPWSPVRRATGAMAFKPRRTPNKPSPRPLPPPSAEDEELVNPFRGRVLRRSPPPGAPPPEEPELPPTPTEKGISDPASVQTSPMGIHNTPTKRPRRSRVLAERIKSSPLKQPPLRPSETVGKFVQEESPPRTKPRRLRAQPQSRKRRRKSHPARNIEESDPLVEKKGLRDSLLAKVAQLQSDLKHATRETNRLHELQQRRDKSTLGEPEDRDGLLDILRRHVLPPEKEVAPDPTQNWFEAALNPISFLPFSKPNTLIPSLFASPKDVAEEIEKPPISHHPVPMTAEEELPYLQVFTPLTFTSTVSIVPRDEGGNPKPLLQKHYISVSSSSPGLFAAMIEMTINTKTLAIVELRVPRLEPSAVGEMGPFIEGVIRGNGTSALTRNISVVTWAMGEWLRIAMRRARFWCAVTRDLGSNEGLARCARQMRKDTRRRAGRPASTVNDGDDDDDDDELEAGVSKMRFTRADLLPHLGRTNLDLELFTLDNPNEVPSVRVQWRIEFDWTGEARSKLGLLLGAPAKWHGRDTRGTLTSIPGMFDRLVQENEDPLEALRTVVALLVGEG